MSRRKLVALVGFGLLGLGWLVAYCASGIGSQRTRLTREILHRVRGGMTKPEVEAILGRPDVEVPFAASWQPSVSSLALWHSPTDGVEVYFNASGNVCDTHFNSGLIRLTWGDWLQLMRHKWLPR
jgi:hypothetical protein